MKRLIAGSLIALALVAWYTAPAVIDLAHARACVNQFIRNTSTAEPTCDTVKIDTDTDKKFGGVAVVRTGTEINNLVQGLTAGIKIKGGQTTTASASDTVATGLATVTSVVCSLEDDPSDDPEWVSCQFGNQAGAPAAGSIIVKTWKNTTGTDPTPLAATTFSKKVNWIVTGT